MNFRPDFSRGVAHAADQQILLANCLQERFEERERLRQAAFERAQALSGGVAISGVLEDLEGWEPTPIEYVYRQVAS